MWRCDSSGSELGYNREPGNRLRRMQLCGAVVVHGRLRLRLDEEDDGGARRTKFFGRSPKVMMSNRTVMSLRCVECPDEGATKRLFGLAGVVVKIAGTQAVDAGTPSYRSLSIPYCLR
ncbi:hypothetical protein L1987_43266 [Smallanthus sonchifolius]|uniref:Uncharacterized protein n=1 Tax=Smallanthus sonchifolius TaxID=185202 RepID=A0ACB9GL97_9ASTR|nr:hypothetical protein L1987_43266 [Smallanthus sonchifolius]